MKLEDKIVKVAFYVAAFSSIGILGGWFWYLPITHFTKGREPLTSTLLGSGIAIEVFGVCLLSRPPWPYATAAIALASIAFYLFWKANRPPTEQHLMNFMAMHYFVFLMVLFLPAIRG